MRSCPRALYASHALLAGATVACTPGVIVAPLDPPPQAVLVVVNRSASAGVIALEPPPAELVLEELARSSGARVDVLAYQRPLAELGLRVEGGLLELAGAEGVPLPPPDRWLGGRSTDDVLAPSTEDLATALADIRVPTPRCPSITVVAQVDLDTHARADAVTALSAQTLYVGTRGQVFGGVVAEPPRHYAVSTDRAAPITGLAQSSTIASTGEAELAVELDGQTWAWTYARGADRPALHRLDADGNIAATRPLAAPVDDVPALLSARGDRWVWGGFGNTVGVVDVEAGRFTTQHSEQGARCEVPTTARILQLDEPSRGVVSFAGGSLRAFTIEGARVVLGEPVLPDVGQVCRAARARDARTGQEVIAVDSPSTGILGDLPAGDVWWRDGPEDTWQRWTSDEFYARAVALAGPHIVLVDRFGFVSVLDVSTRADLPPRWCPGPSLGLSVYSLTRVGEYVVAAGIPLLDAPNRVAWLRVE